jgi:hypothetical protein
VDTRGPGRIATRAWRIASFAGIVLFLAACAQVAVHVRPDAGFDRSGGIAIVAAHGDPIGVKAKLERLLAANGFTIGPEMPQADYVLRFEYMAFYGSVIPGFRRFSAVITDVRSDRDVAAGNFVGDRLADGVLEDFVKTLAAQVP